MENTFEEFAAPSTDAVSFDEASDVFTDNELSTTRQSRSRAGVHILVPFVVALAFTAHSNSAVEFYEPKAHELSSRVNSMSVVLDGKRILSMKEARARALASMTQRKLRKAEMLEKIAREDDVFLS